MYQWVRPRIAIPVHGEARHLAAHAKLAEECQVGQGLAISNGTLVQLRPSGAEILEHVHVGRIGLDGKALLSLDSEVMRVRHRTIWNGSAVVSLAINKRGELLGEPQITVHGLLNEAEHGMNSPSCARPSARQCRAFLWRRAATTSRSRRRRALPCAGPSMRATARSRSPTSIWSGYEFGRGYRRRRHARRRV